ncbi:MAG TPA: carboxypeptidase-like regulatory domain-containing protein, partial [Saprospiraceae bacterium]|nr:carboxypeptidase-like regulatory domain-containing protein [Saprospiraceae bacterium]
MRITLLALCLCCSFLVYGQGSTTSDIKGRVTGPDGLSLIGANVIAIHLPSGTETGTATDEEGYYQLPGMKVGGPYTLRVTYVGYTDVVVE